MRTITTIASAAPTPIMAYIQVGVIIFVGGMLITGGAWF